VLDPRSLPRVNSTTMLKAWNTHHYIQMVVIYRHGTVWAWNPRPFSGVESEPVFGCGIRDRFRVWNLTPVPGVESETAYRCGIRNLWLEIRDCFGRGIRTCLVGRGVSI
jgi:hypothetical protein